MRHMHSAEVSGKMSAVLAPLGVGRDSQFLTAPHVVLRQLRFKVCWPKQIIKQKRVESVWNCRFEMI